MVGSFFLELGMKVVGALVFIILNSLSFFTNSKILHADDSSYLFALRSSIALGFIALVLSYLPTSLKWVSLVVVFVVAIYLIDEYYHKDWKTVFQFMFLWLCFWFVLFFIVFVLLF